MPSQVLTKESAKIFNNGNPFNLGAINKTEEVTFCDLLKSKAISLVLDVFHSNLSYLLYNTKTYILLQC